MKAFNCKIPNDFKYVRQLGLRRSHLDFPIDLSLIGSAS